MEVPLEDYLSLAPRALDLLDLTGSLIDFSRNTYSKFFKGCGLYAVGSSVNNFLDSGGKEISKVNDIDVVLVGMDFRALVKYDKIFLMDPQTLINEEIVIPTQRARREGTVNHSIALLTVDNSGELTIMSPGNPSLPPFIEETLDIDANTQLITGSKDTLRDLTYIDFYKLKGIEFEGNYWANNYQRHWTNFEEYCIGHASTSILSKSIFDHLISEFNLNPSNCRINSPFGQYSFRDINYLTQGISIHDRYCISQKIFQLEHLKQQASSNYRSGSNSLAIYQSEERRFIYNPYNSCDCTPIDLNLHCENLKIDAWKKIQNSLNLPYVILHEWDEAERFTRPILTHERLPDYVDYYGQNLPSRESPNPYFHFKPLTFRQSNL